MLAVCLVLSSALLVDDVDEFAVTFDKESLMQFETLDVVPGVPGAPGTSAPGTVSPPGTNPSPPGTGPAPAAPFPVPSPALPAPSPSPTWYNSPSPSPRSADTTISSVTVSFTAPPSLSRRDNITALVNTWLAAWALGSVTGAFEGTTLTLTFPLGAYSGGVQALVAVLGAATTERTTFESVAGVSVSGVSCTPCTSVPAPAEGDTYVRFVVNAVYATLTVLDKALIADAVLQFVPPSARSAVQVYFSLATRARQSGGTAVTTRFSSTLLGPTAAAAAASAFVTSTNAPSSSFATLVARGGNATVSSFPTTTPAPPGFAPSSAPGVAAPAGSNTALYALLALLVIPIVIIIVVVVLYMRARQRRRVPIVNPDATPMTGYSGQPQAPANTSFKTTTGYTLHTDAGPAPAPAPAPGVGGSSPKVGGSSPRVTGPAPGSAAPPPVA